MSFDYYERQDIMQRLKSLDDSAKKQADNSDKMVAAFNRIADALTALTGELKEIRKELSPSLGKSKLSAPAQKG